MMRIARFGRREFATLRSSHVAAAGDDGVKLHALVQMPDAQSPSRQEPVLLLPCAFGSVSEDFRYQLSALGDKYTFVGIDPRGYGKSRPPERDFPTNYFERDARDVATAMEELGYDKFSIVGWSAGANVGAVLAATYPDRVSRLVLINGNAFVCDEDLEAYETYEDVARWQKSAREQGEAVYGAGNLQQRWSEMLAKLKSIYEDDGDLYCGSLPRISCKTLVVAGGKDKLVQPFHGEYLSERILHSRMHLFPTGRHDVLQSEADEFNVVLDNFLQEPDDKLTQSREFVARPVV